MKRSRSGPLSAVSLQELAAVHYEAARASYKLFTAQGYFSGVADLVVAWQISAAVYAQAARIASGVQPASTADEEFGAMR